MPKDGHSFKYHVSDSFTVEAITRNKPINLRPKLGYNKYFQSIEAMSVWVAAN